MTVCVGVLTQGFVEGLAVRAVHVRFGHQWKTHAVLGSGELANLLVCTGLLRTELIARKADHGQVIVCFVKGLQSGILRRSPARAGHVHDQPACSAKASKGGGFAVHGCKGYVDQFVHGTI